MPMLARQAVAAAAAFGFNQGLSTLRIGSSIGNTSAPSTTTSLSWPAGSAAGDLAVVYVAYQGSANNNTITGGAGGVWTKDALLWSALGYYSAVFSKTLASGDLAGNTLNAPDAATDVSSPYIIVVYRGPTVLSVKSTVTNGTGTTITLTGFTKAGNSKAVVSCVADRDPSATPSTGSPFTAVRGPGTSINFTANLNDVLSVNQYVGGNVTWSGFGNTFEQTGYLLELT